MSPIKDFDLTYEILNKGGTFSEGDPLTGKVTFTLMKDIKVKSLFVKFKGDAHVQLTGEEGAAHRRCFKVKEYLIAENAKETVLPRGIHHFKFRLKIPQESMPSTFQGVHGRIEYILEAKMCRSLGRSSRAIKQINFVSKSLPEPGQVNYPQSGSVNKEMGIFSKGQVQMSATVNTKICSPGETLSIVAKICNSSSKKVTPKYSMMQKTVYRTRHSTNKSEKSLCKRVGNTISPNSEDSVSCQLKIPVDVSYSVWNCEIISVEYYLKVYLDISFAIDPKLVFPLFVIPRDFAAFQPVGSYPGGAAGGPVYSDFPPPAVPVEPYPAGAIGGQSNSDFLPPAMAVGPYPASLYSGSYRYPGTQGYSVPPPAYSDNPPAYAGSPGVNPVQPVHMSGGYNNPVPQVPSPYGSPFSSSSSSSVLHPPPTAPTFHPPVSAPMIHPSPSPLSFNMSPTVPTCNLVPSAQMMNTDFLSQPDEAPPEYSLIFPSSDTKKSDAK